MTTKSLVFAALSIGYALCAAADTNSFRWPNEKGAAVCLTYDDSLASQLDVAYPQLEEAGLKGTFFLQGNGRTMNDRLDDWRDVASAGHELASHSLFHPCRKALPGRDWVAANRDLDQYSLDRVRSELEITNTLLHAIDGQSTRTFAYPCGDTAAEHGESSFLPIADDLFVASRGVYSNLGSIRDLDFNNTPGFDPSGKDLSASIAYLEDCYEKGTVAVFLMHGVGGDYLVTDAELHQALLDYLVENQDRFWIDTFKNVMTHAHAEFQRLGWDER
ncbi:polysaccharide deacetylase family protein [Pelagicoccus sp. SDUM812003]|uniref:polysaccharide deacetylase family protein n=1 Tax=Pelagicoccus sp. SDUM812003 TaxID=3041267 RepID=UPI00280CB925|nr:polysaccharide deacetylase family protein [Pelagicoccus sp. SDUM812003]MDQ8201388.1 polysaccharide deacetylase family protein [Pelagicoccus sp. SDUM812003]